MLEVLREDDDGDDDGDDDRVIKMIRFHSGPFHFSFIHSLSQSTVQHSANDALFVKYMCTRFILRRNSALTNHSISVLSVYSFIFGLIEHNPYCRQEREDADDTDNAVATDDTADGPYGQRFARIVSRNSTRAGVMYFIN